MKKYTGFTLVELMITIAIVSVLLVVGLPSLKTFMQGNQLVASTNELISAFHVARSEAIKRNSNITICESTNGTSCSTTDSWDDGWIVFVDGSSDPDADPVVVPADRVGTGVPCTSANTDTDCLLRSHAAFTDDLLVIKGEDVSTSTSVSSVTFNARGLPKSAGGGSLAANFSVCSLVDADNTIGSRAVVLSLTGRVRVSDNAAVITLCP